jgi:beta-galactosidase GanA
MVDAGINCVRLFDFAWHRFEPREWEFDFEWATRVLDLLRDARIDVIVATPTAAPPAWMAAKYPEILRVNSDGRRATGGLGRNWSPVSPRYREFCVRVTDQMVHAFRGHDAVVGWQVDHRMSGTDYSNEARRAFHSWLYDRFGHIDGLNKTWGLEGGSLAYEYFEQVPLPALGDLDARTPAHRVFHPSLVLAFRRFLNDQWSSFIQVQAEMIRNGFETPISANGAPTWSMNVFRQNQLLDRVGLSSSNAHGTCSASSPDALRHALAHFDRMRGEKPGVAYWHFDAPVAGPDATSLAWLALFSGAELHLADQWRAPWSGPGMGRGGIVSATGGATANRPAFVDLVRQVKEQAEYLHPHPPVEARVGVVVSIESAWAFEVEPPEAGFDYPTVWRDDFYLPVVRQHYWRDVIDQTADFCPYNVLVMPLLPIVYRPTKERLREWVSDGGCLLLGPLTGYRSEEFTAWPDDEFGGLEPLMGGTCGLAFEAEGASVIWGPPAGTAEDPAAEAASPPQSGPAPKSMPRGWCHAFTATTAHVLARYETGPAAGLGGILMHKLGQGTVITIGARMDADTYLDLVHTLCDLAKVEPLATGSPDVAVIPRMNPDASVAAYGLVNLSAQAQTVTLPQGGPDRLTGEEAGSEVTIGPRGVMLVQVTPWEPPPAPVEIVAPADAALPPTETIETPSPVEPMPATSVSAEPSPTPAADLPQ